MAISKTITTPFGIEVHDAYIRIEALEITNKTDLRFWVRKYADKTKAAIETLDLRCTFDIDGENPFKQAYESLKLRPEFEGSEDC